MLDIIEFIIYNQTKSKHLETPFGAKQRITSIHFQRAVKFLLNICVVVFVVSRFVRIYLKIETSDGADDMLYFAIGFLYYWSFFEFFQVSTDLT